MTEIQGQYYRGMVSVLRALTYGATNKSQVKQRKEEYNYNFTQPCKAESIERSLLLIGWAEEASLRGIFKLR